MTKLDDSRNNAKSHLAGLIDPHPGHRLRLAAIAGAMRVIDPLFLNSPRYECESLSEALGCRLTLKLETANPIRSFKGRGASFLIREMIARHPEDRTAIVGASAGNWGQAVAHACRDAGLPAIFYAAVNANPLKIERMRALGAEVRLHGADFDAAKIEAAAFAARSGGRMVMDGRDREVSEGAGTIGVELVVDGARFDAVLAPLGNGALLNGVGRWLKAAAPGTRVIGVSAEGADAMKRSWRERRLVLPSEARTIADGIAVRVPIQEAVDDMDASTDDVLLVSDEHIVKAMRLLYQRAGLLIEPAGAAGVAALIAYPERFRGKHAAAILCGGNLTADQIKAWLTA